MSKDFRTSDVWKGIEEQAEHLDKMRKKYAGRKFSPEEIAFASAD